MIIPVKVKKRILTCKKPLVSENVETYSISVNVDEEWSGFNTRVVFYNNAMEIGEDNPKNVVTQDIANVTIPWEVLQEPGYLYLTLIGTKDNEVIKTKEMDNPIVINKAGISEGGTPLEPTPDTIQIIIDTARQAVDIAQSVRDDANAGKFNGAQGPKGDPGTTDFNQLQNLPVISVLKDSIELTTLSDGFYIINVESCNILVSNETKGTFTKGAIICKSGTSFSYWDNEGIHYIYDFHNDAEWINDYHPTRAEMDEELAKKQDTLVSGENIKTINNTPVLGNGNIDLPLSPITVIDDEKYTIRQEGLFYFTKDAEMGFINGNYAPGQGLVRTKNIHANTLVYKKDLGLRTTLIFFTPVEPSEDESGNLIGGLSLEYIDLDGNESIFGFSDFINYISNILTILGDVGYQDPNRIIITKEHNDEDGTFSFDTIGIGKGLKLENQELSSTMNWATLKNEQISADTDHYTLSNLGVGEYYIWISKGTPINTGVKGSLTVNLFGTNFTLGDLETDSKHIILHVVKMSDHYALLDWSTIMPDGFSSLSNNRKFGTFPFPVLGNSLTIRTSAGNFSKGTNVQIFGRL